MGKHHVQEALDLLSSAMDPFIEERMRPFTGGLEWTVVLQELDRMRGKGAWTYSRSDPSLQLRMLTERLGALGHPFDEGDRNRTLGTYGQVMRIVRNRLSHGDTFEAFDALHAVDTVRTILAHIGDESGTVMAAGIRTALISELLENSDTGIGGKIGPNKETDTSFSGADNVGNLGEKGSSMSGAAAGNPSSWLAPIGDLQGALVWEPWTPVIVGEQEDLDSMRRTRVRETVRALIEDIAQAEGPVHQDRVARLVGLAFGFSRLVSARARRIVGQIPRASVTVDADGFVWPDGVDRDTWLIHRTSSDAERPFEHISSVEIANAAASVIRDADNAVPSGELRTLVLQQFGRKRGSRTANAQLERGLAYAATSGRIS